MEPERKIEKWLRVFAAKRRDQAPDSSGFELHPATRRMLQSEVRRQFGAPERKPASFRQNLLRFSIRPVAVLAVIAVVAALAALLLPSLSAAKRKSQSLSALSNLRQIGLAAHLFSGDNHGRLPVSYGEMTNYLSDNTLTIDPVSGGRFIYVGSGQQLSNLQPGSVLAYSPTDKKGRAVLFADGHVELADREHFAELTNRGLLQLAFADEAGRERLAETHAAPPPAAAAAETMPPPVAGATPAGTVTVADATRSFTPGREKSKGADLGLELARAERSESRKLEIAGAAGAAGDSSAVRNAIVAGTNAAQFAAGISQRFVRADITTGVQYGYQSGTVSGKAVPVLASFQVQQNGAEIRVVDRDGSVYNGYGQWGGLIIPNEVAAGGARLTSNEGQSFLPAAAAVQKELVPSRQLEERDMRAAEGAGPAAQNYFFRVAGTNQSLKQSVVFTGHLLALPNEAPVAQTGHFVSGGGGGGGTQNAPAGQAPQWLLANSRIAGTAVVGNTNQIEINAVPVAP
jgi:prepilin-type processing-associated H-X9-DG protein